MKLGIFWSLQYQDASIAGQSCSSRLRPRVPIHSSFHSDLNSLCSQLLTSRTFTYLFLLLPSSSRLEHHHLTPPTSSSALVLFSPPLAGVHFTSLFTIHHFHLQPPSACSTYGHSIETRRLVNPIGRAAAPGISTLLYVCIYPTLIFSLTSSCSHPLQNSFVVSPIVLVDPSTDFEARHGQFVCSN